MQVESELRAELQRLQSEKSQLDENLSSLSEAYNALERDYNDLQSTRCVLSSPDNSTDAGSQRCFSLHCDAERMKQAKI